MDSAHPTTGETAASSIGYSGAAHESLAAGVNLNFADRRRLHRYDVRGRLESP